LLGIVISIDTCSTVETKCSVWIDEIVPDASELLENNKVQVANK